VDATLQTFFWTNLENDLMKTIALSESVRGQRNAASGSELNISGVPDRETQNRKQHRIRRQNGAFNYAILASNSR
jgi:hypothetical protein